VNVLFLTQGPETSPSPRYRVYQLLPELKKHGITGVVSPVTSRRVGDILRQRRADIARAREFDVVFVQKGITPGIAALFEERLAAVRPVVFDLDDAIWLPRRGGNPVLRWLHRESTVQRALRCASAVIAGSPFLADYARQFNPQVTVVPSAIDLARYPFPHRSRGPATIQSNSIEGGRPQPPTGAIGWIGSRTTLPYLAPLGPVFQQLGITPLVIASGNPAKLGFAVDFRQWRLETELADLAQIGIGVAPLTDSPWERGKCAVKLLQYLACGIPVVASPVGVHTDIVQDGVNGFLARDESEWTEKLRQLLNDPALCHRLGAAGRRTVEEKYSLDKIASKVAGVLHDVVKGKL